jgi:hypothetical protein
MNSSNLFSRQFIQNTCELSIEDKKSPFPAWMKFNKPNPLRFSLNLQDPDRPELEPVQVTGDRAKLETLQDTVDKYVKEIVAQAPMATMGEEASKLPSRATDERPIDALKVNDNHPRLEPDGPSRHLFYLGNSADANAAVLSLSTLQLFDISSVLNEALAPDPVVVPEDSSSLLTTPTGGALVEPISEIQDSAIKTNEASLLSTNNLSNTNNLEEARVILPSINDDTQPVTDEFYSLETESSILERGGANRSNTKSSKPGMGSLNLPELPDFSQSPLTSIPLWLGLGTMASFIIAFPFLSSYFKNSSSVATKPSTPVVSTSPSPSAEEATPTPYQPSSASLPGSVVPSVSVTTSSGTGIPVVPNPALGVGSNNNTSTLFSNNVGQTNRQTTNQRSDAGTGTRQDKKPSTSPDPAAKTGAGKNNRNTSGSQSKGMRPPSETIQPTAIPNSSISTGSGSRTGRTAQNTPRTDDDAQFNSLPSGDINSNVFSNAGRGKKTTTNNSNTSFDTTNGGNLADAPISRTSIPTDSAQPLESQPNVSSDSVQVQGVQTYFQQRWKADPSAQESLQYRIKVGQNGRVQSIEGQGNYSQIYLDKTRFMKPGDQVSAAGKKDQSVWLILRQDGDVQALPEN